MPSHPTPTPTYFSGEQGTQQTDITKGELGGDAGSQCVRHYRNLQEFENSGKDEVMVKRLGRIRGYFLRERERKKRGAVGR